MTILLGIIAIIVAGLSMATYIEGASHRRKPMLIKTADYTVVEDDVGRAFSTQGAAGAVVFSLPAAKVGMRFEFYVQETEELRIDPNGTETIALPSTGVQGAAGKYLTANAIGEFVVLECTTAGAWEAPTFGGTWTAEA